MTFLEPDTTFGQELRFTPYAWGKLLYMRDKGDTEVGGYGITETDDPLLVTDFRLVKQECTGATVELDEKGSAEFAEKCLDEGLAPWQTSNIWCHTHPGNCAKPSGTDEENFRTNFGHPHWAVFFILAQEGDEYCRMRFNVGPGCETEIPIVIDYGEEFGASDFDAWEKEYKENVSKAALTLGYKWSNDKKKYETGTEYNVVLPDINEFGELEYPEIEPEIFWSNGLIWSWNEEEDECYSYDPVTDSFEDEAEQAPGPKTNREWLQAIRNWAKENPDPGKEIEEIEVEL